MEIEVCKAKKDLFPDCIKIWNQVVEDGAAFPQTEGLTEETGALFFEAQTYTGAAIDKQTGEVLEGVGTSAMPAMQ